MLEGRAAPVRRVLSGEGGPVAGIVIAPTEDRLPAATTTVVDQRSDLGESEVRYPLERTRVPDVLTNGLDLPTARRAGRALARFEDPELSTGSSSLPNVVRLLPLLGLGLEDVTGERVATGWKQAGIDPPPSPPVGVSDTGPFVIDLATDGPHGLIGGTTGSGKRMLRTRSGSLPRRSASTGTVGHLPRPDPVDRRIADRAPSSSSTSAVAVAAVLAPAAPIATPARATVVAGGMTVSECQRDRGGQQERGDDADGPGATRCNHRRTPGCW